jgi:cytochrome c
MKKLITVSLALTVLAACGGNSSKETKKDSGNDLSENPDYQKGLDVIGKSNCSTCHKIDEPLTGPPFRDIANKYAGMPDSIVDHLAKKIIEGGSGVWGQIPMLPHPELSVDDAKAVARYILLLKK